MQQSSGSYGATAKAQMAMSASSPGHFLDPEHALKKATNAFAGEKDGLVHYGNKSLDKRRKDYFDDLRQYLVLHATMLTVLPWLTFVAAMVFGLLIAASARQGTLLVAYLVLSIAGILSATALARASGSRRTKSRWRRWVGRLAQLGNLLGLAAGFYIYYATFFYFTAYNGERIYSNIGASEDVAQFTDAGFMQFTRETRLDFGRAVGFKDAASNSMLCVAPVVDSSMDRTSEVHFFAIGRDCCEPRGSFDCDDGLDSGAHSAMLVLDENAVNDPINRWTGLGGFDRRPWDAAIRMQHAAYGTIVASETRLLYWTKNPKAQARKFYNHGLELCLSASGLHLLFSIFVAWHHMLSVR